jgi:hypothetical protein
MRTVPNLKYAETDGNDEGNHGNVLNPKIDISRHICESYG